MKRKQPGALLCAVMLCLFTCTAIFAEEIPVTEDEIFSVEADYASEAEEETLIAEEWEACPAADDLIVDEGIELIAAGDRAAETSHVTISISLYDKASGSWVNAADAGAISSVAINGENVRELDAECGKTSTIQIILASGYMTNTPRANDSFLYSNTPEEYRYGTNPDEGEWILTFIPQAGTDYSFSISLSEAVRVTYDRNGGTTDESWPGDSRLVGKGSVISSIKYDIERISPPEGQELDYVEIRDSFGTHTVKAVDLESTAYSYDSDVVFRCVWKTIGQTGSGPLPEDDPDGPPSEMITISKKPSIKKPAATKNRITVKWSHFKHTKKSPRAIWKKIKNVQFQCASDKDFSNIVRSGMVGRGKTKAVIKGLQKKTVYYVRVRYFDGTGYSNWSGTKKIRTKK